MKYGLSIENIKSIQEVFKKYPQIDSAILYGSRAKGSYKKGSDVDLTLRGNSIDLRLISQISNDLDDLLTPYKFDLSSIDDIENKELLDHIDRVGIEFYTKN